MTPPPPAAAGLELAGAQADGATIKAIVADTGVDTTVPGPSVGAYLESLGTRLAEHVIGFVHPSSRTVGVLLELATWIAAAVIVVAVGLLLYRLLRFLLRTRIGPPQTGREAVSVTRPRPGAATHDAAAWWSAFEAARSDGRVADALRALWWWLARSLAGDTADDSWTSSDLARRTEEPGLVAALRNLDLLVYGPAEPSPEQVARLTDDLRRLVAAAAARVRE